jgi:hypothetical protein
LQKVTHTAPRVLVLVPTRELAAQVLASVRTYGAHTGLRSLAVFGGVGINPQIQSLRRGIDILVATPGRLLDHLGQRTVDLSKVQTLVLDEADRMFDMGFIRDIRRIIEKLPKVRQNLMFSATFAAEVRELAHTVLKDPAMVEVARRNAPAELVTHTVIKVDKDTEARPAAASLRRPRLAPGAGVLPHQARLRRAGQKAGTVRRAHRGPARQQVAERPHPRAGRLQGRQAGGAGRHRHRRARPRHRFAAARGEFRTAQRARRLRPPHRPHRPCRRQRRSACRWSAATSASSCATSSAC